jgi:hypothetical protein
MSHPLDPWTEAQRIGVMLTCTRACDDTASRPAIEALISALGAEIVVLRPRVQPIGRIRSTVLGMATLRLDVAVILTPPNVSPYPVAYLSYLAGIKHRVGLSSEFGGSLLTRWVQDPAPPLPEPDRYLYLLRATGLQVPLPKALVDGEVELSRYAS